MSVFNDIQNALNNELNGLSGLPAIYWPNSQKEPLQNQSWLRPTLLPAQSTLYTLNNGNSHQGLYQVDIFVPLKAGTAQLNTYADIIRDGLNRVTCVSGTTNVIIQQISISQQQRIEAWWSCYVEVGYLCVA